jgi:hypothetical protein
MQFLANSARIHSSKRLYHESKEENAWEDILTEIMNSISNCSLIALATMANIGCITREEILETIQETKHHNVGHFGFSESRYAITTFFGLTVSALTWVFSLILYLLYYFARESASLSSEKFTKKFHHIFKAFLVCQIVAVLLLGLSTYDTIKVKFRQVNKDGEETTMLYVSYVFGYVFYSSIGLGSVYLLYVFKN